MKIIKTYLDSILKEEGLRKTDNDSDKSFGENAYSLIMGDTTNADFNAMSYTQDQFVISVVLRKILKKNNEDDFDFVEYAQGIRCKVCSAKNYLNAGILLVEPTTIGQPEKSEAFSKITMNFNFYINSSLT